MYLLIMSEIRNLTRNGETFYPLTTMSAVLDEETGRSMEFPVDTRVGLADYEVADEDGNVIVSIKDGEITAKKFDSNDLKRNYPVGDFSIADQNNNVIACFKDGNIETKYFNSKDLMHLNLKSKDYIIGNFALGDEHENIILLLQDGHIKTKNFDSRKNERILNILNIVIDKFKGRKVAIIGDSISTYSGTMPSGYTTYYPHGDVNDIKYMWWNILCSNLGMQYVNTSWSGSSVTGTPKGTTAYSGCSDKRAQDAGRDGAPDYIIILFGINDFTGSVDLGNWQVNQPIIDDSSYSTTDRVSEFRMAYSLMINKLQVLYPECRIVCCSLVDTLTNDAVQGWPADNADGVALNQYNENIREIATAMDCVFINLAACGITYNNLSVFMIDEVTHKLHPNLKGQKLMGDFVTKQFIFNV